MDEDLFVLLIPGIKRVPVEAGRASQPADLIITEYAQPGRSTPPARNP
jgi:hypothetical protein